MRWRRGRGGDRDQDDVRSTGPAGTTPDTAPDAADDWRPDADPGPAPAPAPSGDGFDGDPPTRVDVPLDLVAIDPAELERSTRRAVARALAEDLGDRGDLTSLATVPAGTTGRAELVARADGVVAGTEVVRAVFDQVDPRVAVELAVADGDRVSAGQVLGTVSGPLRSVLTAERTALNFLGHLSGIATRTRAFVDAVAGTGCAIRDTRKTTPGLRLLEKAAVRAGGGHNHRMGLHDALLVKDNHVAAAGSIAAATEAALRREGVHVQVEVASIDQLDDVLRLGVTDILLDNLTPDQVRQAVKRVDGRAALEASGTITLDTVADYAATGVGRVAVGGITHSAPNLDVALDVRVDEQPTPAPIASVWSEAEGGARTDAADTPPPAEPEPPAPGDAEAPAPADDDLEGPSRAAGYEHDDDLPELGESGLFAWRERQLGERGRDT